LTLSFEKKGIYKIVNAYYKDVRIRNGLNPYIKKIRKAKK